MSGHSKWSQIKHKKAATDAKRSQLFSKMAKIISLAARKGENPDMNSDLKTVIDRAKEANMPKDAIERAIKKGSGKIEGAQLENVRYEVYGPGGTAIIIEGITDNKNRTVAEIKHILSKNNLKLAETGSVIWAFDYKENIWDAKNKIEINEEDAEKIDKLLEELDDHDDINELFTNAS